MIKRLFSHCILRPSDLTPLRETTQIAGAFNPGAVDTPDGVVLLVRVVEEVTEKNENYYASPRINADGGFEIDWLAKDQIDMSDPRLYTSKADGSLRLRFISHIKVVRLGQDDQTPIDFDGPVIAPKGPYEEYGIEDPRVTKIGGTYYITYVAVSRHGINTCLMSTTDFVEFERHGIIFCSDNKDVVLFPEKIVGEYVAMHRPMPNMKFSTPRIWIARSTDLMRWGNHRVLLDGDDRDSERIGGGTPPIATDRGWLTVYHGNDRLPTGPNGEINFCYTGGALLLDSENPAKVIGHTPKPFMVPELDFETKGFVDNVVFPTAITERDEHFLIYYGAADESTAVCAYDKNELLALLEAT